MEAFMGRIENNDYTHLQIARCDADVLRITLDRQGEPVS